MSTPFPGETKKYRAARDKLLQEEIELRRATEAVAAARRALPQGEGPRGLRLRRLRTRR